MPQLLMTSMLTVMVIYWVWAIYHFGKKRQQYSHIKQTISELGESGSVYELSVGYGFFLPIGVLLFIMAIFFKGNNDATWLSFFLGCGYFFSAFFPCDPKTPLMGSWKNSMHNVAGAVCYIGCISVLKDMSDASSNVFIDIVLLLLLVFLMNFILGWPKFVGLFQRVGELALFAVIFLQI